MTHKGKSAGGILGMFSLLLRRGQEKRRSCFSSRFLGPAWIWVLELLPTRAQRKTQLRDTAEKQTWSPDTKDQWSCSYKASLLYGPLLCYRRWLASGCPAPDEGLPPLFPNTQGFSNLRVLVQLLQQAAPSVITGLTPLGLIPFLWHYAPPSISTSHAESPRESMQFMVYVSCNSTHPQGNRFSQAWKLLLKPSPKPMANCTLPGLTVL